MTPTFSRTVMPFPTFRLCGLTPLFVVATIALSGCDRSQTDTADTSPAEGAPAEVVFTAEQVQHGGVRWAPAESAITVATLEVPGKLSPNEDATARLGAPAQGRLVSVHVQLGDRVSRGQALVTLQSPAAGVARADFAKALAELTSRRAASNFARSAKERAERLLEAKAIARQDVDRARADDELARAAEQQADAEVDRARTALLQLGVDSATGLMVIRSPLDGVVLTRDAVPGSVVDAGALLVTVSNLSTLWLDVAATERAAGSLARGTRARFSVPAFPSDTFEARVQGIGGAFDPTTRTLPVRAVVQNRRGLLRPEMFATVWIDGGAPRPGVSVPDSAIQQLDERAVVFIARPDGKGGARFERREVEPGGTTDGRTHIVRGLAPGDLVVVSGAFAVKSEFARSKMTEG